MATPSDMCVHSTGDCPSSLRQGGLAPPRPKHVKSSLIASSALAGPSISGSRRESRSAARSLCGEGLDNEQFDGVACWVCSYAEASESHSLCRYTRRPAVPVPPRFHNRRHPVQQLNHFTHTVPLYWILPEEIIKSVFNNGTTWEIIPVLKYRKEANCSTVTVSESVQQFCPGAAVLSTACRRRRKR